MLLLRYATFAGNIPFMMWIPYNGIKEGLRGTWPEKASYIGLMAYFNFVVLFIFYQLFRQ